MLSLWWQAAVKKLKKEWETQKKSHEKWLAKQGGGS